LCPTGLWRKLPNEELHDVCCAPNIISVIKWRVGRGADIRQKRNAKGILVEKPQGMSVIGVDERITLSVFSSAPCSQTPSAYLPPSM